ncbi:hypothetical protein EC9_32060 [Rosistilla ulvae]|uniref:YHS domain protein n=1 Tax=Rosistilla ulvae TaxID=1930277 RepID=A0A517M2E1_9BACT|nr:hypothetical protein [Rosistilla ulvae]QDS89009.1 hypothetical protein EC9_32060 [Rosistilla ulvae]
MRLSNRVPVLIAASLAVGLFGCSPAAPNTPPASADHESHAHEEHVHGSEHSAADTASSMEEQMSGLKQLSPEDYKSAMAQHICPVSGEMLGTMDAPKKFDVEGNSVWICCDGCKDKLLAAPDKYLARLN